MYRPSHPVFLITWCHVHTVQNYNTVLNGWKPYMETIEARWDRPVMEKVLASQVSVCFSSLQLTAAFHEMVLLFQHVFGPSMEQDAPYSR